MFCSGENLLLYLSLFFSLYILCMGQQEPFTGAAPSKGLVLHNLLTNTLIYVEESEVASLSSRNSAGFKGKA